MIAGREGNPAGGAGRVLVPALLLVCALGAGLMTCGGQPRALAANEFREECGQGGQGVTDHGGLSGLTDDDHPQYCLRGGQATFGNVTAARAFLSETLTVDGSALGLSSFYAARFRNNGGILYFDLDAKAGSNAWMRFQEAGADKWYIYHKAAGNMMELKPNRSNGSHLLLDDAGSTLLKVQYGSTSSVRDKFVVYSSPMIWSGTGWFGNVSSVDGRFSRGLRAGSYTQTGNPAAPPSQSSPGKRGEVRFTKDYIFFCYSTGAWRRAAVSGW